MAQQSTEKRHGAIVQFRPQPRRLVVRITAADGRAPVGRTRALRLRESDLMQLVDVAQRLEARR